MNGFCEQLIPHLPCHAPERHHPLDENAQPLAAGPKPGRRARRFAEATGTLAKTDRIDARLLACMAATLQPPVRPTRSPPQMQLAELSNARDGLVRDRTALKNREMNLPSTLLRRQCQQRLQRIARHIEALDAEIAAVIAADPRRTRRHQILTSIDGLGTLTANQRIATGKPAKLGITAIMRKLVVIANALLKADRLWRKSIA